MRCGPSSMRRKSEKQRLAYRLRMTPRQGLTLNAAEARIRSRQRWLRRALPLRRPAVSRWLNLQQSQVQQAGEPLPRKKTKTTKTTRMFKLSPDADFAK